MMAQMAEDEGGFLPQNERLNNVIFHRNVLDNIAAINLDGAMIEPGTVVVPEPHRITIPGFLRNYNYNPEVTKIGDKIYWDFRDPNYDTTTHTSKGGIETDRAYTCRHNIVAEALGMTDTDVALCKIFPESDLYDDGNDILSPDYMHRSQQGLVVVAELATTRGRDRYSLEASFTDKKVKYMYALRNRAEVTLDRVFLAIIVVSEDTILTNLLLPGYIVRDIFYRMKMAVAIEIKAVELGVKLGEEDLPQSVRKQEIYDSISRVELGREGRGPYKMTEEDLEIYSSRMDDLERETFLAQMGQMVKEGEKARGSGQITLPEALSMWRRSEDGKECSTRVKPCVNTPLFYVRRNPEHDTKLGSRYIYTEGPCEAIIEIWQEAWDASAGMEDEVAYEDSYEREDGLYEVLTIDDEESQRNPKTLKNKYHRVTLKLRDDLKVHLALDGVGAKKMSDLDIVKDKKKEMKSRVSCDISTSDIDSFLKDERWNEPQDSSSGFEEIEDLIKLSDQLVGNKGAMTSVIKELSKTKIALALDLLSELNQELAISARQQTEKDQFIIKKLPHYNVFLLIKSTNIQSHVFYSIMVPKKDLEDSFNLPFHGFVYSRDYAFTEFLSITPSKMPNRFVLAQTWISSIIRWTCEYNMDPELIHSSRIPKDVSFMSRLWTLVAMCDKAEVESEMTLARFMYMEMFKTTRYSSPNPLKMVLKFNGYPRNRMTIWVQKRLLNGFAKMLEEPPRLVKQDMSRYFDPSVAEKMEEGIESPSGSFIRIPGGYSLADLAKDEWQGLINIYTGSDIRFFPECISVSYSGYSKDKNECPQGNSDWQLVEKILEEEFKLNKDREMFYGIEEPPIDDIQNHEFSPSALKMGCVIAAKELTKKFGPTFKVNLQEMVLDKLARVNSVKLATLKATAAISDLEDLHLESIEDVDKKAGRRKVIEAASDFLDSLGAFPFRNIDKVIKELESENGGVFMDLFKKQQHAGLREIYVLTYPSRIVQLFIEICARTIAEQFDIDTLTHPDNKNRLFDEHTATTNQLSKAMNAHVIQCKSSLDKTRWSQHIMVRTFALIFCQLLPKRLARLLLRALNLWYGKNIKFPPGLQKLLITSTKLTPPCYVRLLEEFWDTSAEAESFLECHMKKYFRTKSGMGQGVLHYSSTLVHVMERLSYKAICHYLFKKAFPTCELLVSAYCCSDDSATLMTALVPKDQGINLSEVERYIHILSHGQSYHGLLCNMRESIKSTIGTVSVLEYNSSFVCRGSVAVPTIKFTEPLLKENHTESIKSRLEDQYNTLRSLAENGACALEARSAQLLQGWVHYKTLGKDVNRWFHKFKQDISVTHNVDLGFFPMDPELCPGILGQDYAIFLIAVNGSHKRNIQRMISTGAVDCTDKGTILSSAVLTFGNRKRWNSLKANVIKQFDWEAMVEQRPESLYEFAETIDDCRIQMSALSCSSGVYESLNTGNNFFNCITSSVYSLNRPCFTVRRITKEEGKIETELVKTSLLGAIKIAQEEWQKVDMPIEDMFPAANVYNQITQKLAEIKGLYRKVRIPRLRKKLTKLTFFPLGNDVDLELSRCAKTVWFKTKARISNRTIRSAWARYKRKIPWLRDTVKETLKESPFSSHVSLKNFIESSEKAIRTSRVIAAPVRGNNFLEQLEDLICINYCPGKRLVKPRTTDQPGIGEEDYMSKLSELSKHVSLILMYPMGDQEKLDCILDVMGAIGLRRINDQLLMGMSNRNSYLYLMGTVGSAISSRGRNSTQLLRDLTRTEEVVKSIRNLKDVAIDFITVSQTKTEDKSWRGYGKTNIQIGKLRAVLTYEGPELVRIDLNDPGALISVMPCFRAYLKYTGHTQAEIKVYDEEAIAVLSGSILRNPRYDGVPIYPIRTDDQFTMSLEPLSLMLEVDGDTLLLKTMQKITVKSEDKKTYNTIHTVPRTLCFFKPDMGLSLHDRGRAREGPTVVEGKDIMSKWISSEPADPEELAKEVHRLMMKEESKDMELTQEDNDLIQWLRLTFKCRVAMSLGVIVCPPQQCPSAPSVDVSALEAINESANVIPEIFGEDIEFNFLGDEGFDYGALLRESSAKSESSHSSEDSEEEDTTEYATDMDAILAEDTLGAELDPYTTMLQQENVLTATRTTIMGTHPLWDRYIDFCVKTNPTMIQLAAEGRIVSNESQSRQLIWLLGQQVKENPPETQKILDFFTKLDQERAEERQRRKESRWESIKSGETRRPSAELKFKDEEEWASSKGPDVKMSKPGTSGQQGQKKKKQKKKGLRGKKKK